MIVRKKKDCKACKLPKYLFSKGLCKHCWNKSYKPKVKPRPKIKKISNRGYERNKLYKKARLEYLETHPCCEVKLPGCTIPHDGYDASGLQVHHKLGRIGDLLYDKRYFLAVCHSCHEAITRFGNLAISHGWSLPRLNKRTEKSIEEETKDNTDAPEIQE